METSSAPLTERRYVVPLILVTSLFFLWALGVNLNDILIPHLKKAFSLTDFQSSLIQSAFFGGYFIAALPAGWLISDWSSLRFRHRLSPDIFVLRATDLAHERRGTEPYPGSL